MTTDGTAAPGGGAAGKTGPPAFDTTVAHHARMYDYALGGKDNISQVVLLTPHSAPTAAVQVRDSDNSKI
jgi:S-adenosyl methyltransferase